MPRSPSPPEPVPVSSASSTFAWIAIIATGLYALAGGYSWRQLALAPKTHTHVALMAGTAAWLLHGVQLYLGMRADVTVNLGLTNAISLVAWVVIALFLLAALRKPIASLGIAVFPVAAATVLLEWRWPTHAAPLPAASGLLYIHIIVSLLAYSLLSLAIVQSLVLALQERQLHAKRSGGWLHNLPPLQTMEHLMFQLIGVGFVLLTGTVVSGVFFSEQIFGKPLAFTHHIVLSLLAWVVFAVLLFGHWRFGWRGRHAVRWALSGFSLLVLAYFGSKFVFEVVIAR